MSPCSEKGAHLIFQHTGFRLFNGQFSLQNPFHNLRFWQFHVFFRTKGIVTLIDIDHIGIFCFLKCAICTLIPDANPKKQQSAYISLKFGVVVF